MEYFDICDDNGWCVGGTVSRTDAHRDGICHRTAHIWIVRDNNGKKEVLLQKRSMDKDSFPGRFDTSSAGHIQAGDGPLDSACREMNEELGIKAEPGNLEFIGKFRISYEKQFHDVLFKDNEVAFVYLYTDSVDIDSLVLQKEEVDAVEWFELNEVYEACLVHDQKFCVPMGGLNVLREYIEM